MDNKNNFYIAIIDQKRNKTALSEYLKVLNNVPIDIYTNFSINSLEFHDNNYIEELNKQIELINKKTNLLNQKRKKYSYILNYTLKNK